MKEDELDPRQKGDQTPAEEVRSLRELKLFLDVDPEEIVRRIGGTVHKPTSAADMIKPDDPRNMTKLHFVDAIIDPWNIVYFDKLDMRTDITQRHAVAILDTIDANNQEKRYRRIWDFSAVLLDADAIIVVDPVRPNRLGDEYEFMTLHRDGTVMPDAFLVPKTRRVSLTHEQIGIIAAGNMASNNVIPRIVSSTRVGRTMSAQEKRLTGF